VGGEKKSNFSIFSEKDERTYANRGARPGRNAESSSGEERRYASIVKNRGSILRRKKVAEFKSFSEYIRQKG